MDAKEVMGIIKNLEQWDQIETAQALEGEGEDNLLKACKDEGSPSEDLDELRSLVGNLRGDPIQPNGHPKPNGIIRVSSVADRVGEIRATGFKRGAKIGIPAIDRLLSVCPDQITVVTGIPGSGKSELVDSFMVNLASREDWKFAVFSAENPVDVHVGKLIEKYTGQSVFSGDKVSEKEFEKAASWLNDHFFFLDSSSSHTLDSILKRTERLVEEEGVQGLVIDPFNYLDVALETDAITKMLTRLHHAAGNLHIHIWIVAHPQKQYRVNGRFPNPGGMDISGSMSWFSKSDFGITVSRDEEGDTEVTCWKARFKWLGQTGIANLKFDPTCGRFSDGISTGTIAAEIGKIDWGDDAEFSF